MFDRDYYENGVKTGISLYENYRWMPERSFKEAHWIVHHLNIEKYHTVLDFGCAKGFLVKAFRLLGYQAFGLDISEYALNCADGGVRGYLDRDFEGRFNYGFCKDVLEHSLDRRDLLLTLRKMARLSDNWLLVVPLATNGVYNVADYEKDKTHFIKYNAEQWCDMFMTEFEVLRSENTLFGIKDNWSMYEDANLFAFLGTKYRT